MGRAACIGGEWSAEGGWGEVGSQSSKVAVRGKGMEGWLGLSEVRGLSSGQWGNFPMSFSWVSSCSI